MFCIRCGSQTENGESLCDSCLAQSNGQLSYNVSQPVSYGDTPSLSKPLEKRTKLIVPIIGIAIIFLIVVFFFNGNGYKSVIKDYYKAIEKSNEDLYLSVLAPDYIEYFAGYDGWYSDVDEFLEDRFDERLYYFEGMSGRNFKIKVSNIKEEDLTTRQKQKYIDRIYEYYEFRPGSIQDFEQLRLDLKVKGPMGKIEFEVTNINMVKTDGKWYLIEGSLD